MVAGSWNVIHICVGDALLPPAVGVVSVVLAAAAMPAVVVPDRLSDDDIAGVCGGMGHDMDAGDSTPALLATLLAPTLLALERLLFGGGGGGGAPRQL